jgi:hypothetical protein
MRAILLLFAFEASAFGQLDNNVITVTASRNVNTPVDQAALVAYATADFNMTLDDVVAALKSTGITAANLSFVGPSQSDTFAAGFPTTAGVAADSTTEWGFALQIPFSALTQTLSAFASVQTSLAKSAGSMTLDYYVQGAQSSPQAAANSCPYPAVFADARAQAERVATAAGLALGPVVAMTDGSQSIGLQSIAGTAAGIPTTIYLLGTSFSGAVQGIMSGLTPNCALVVQFKLGG